MMQLMYAQMMPTRDQIVECAMESSETQIKKVIFAIWRHDRISYDQMEVLIGYLEKPKKIDL